MSAVHVCPLSQIAVTVAETGASHLVSLIDDSTVVTRPDSISPERHLFLGVNDIWEPQDGLVMPGEEHVRQLIAFVRAWDRRQPMVIHCFAGISRSTAAAFIAVCMTEPDRSEAEIAAEIRALSRYATPNPRIVAIADDLLGRNGRMVDAVAAIGRGEVAHEGVRFALHLGSGS